MISSALSDVQMLHKMATGSTDLTLKYTGRSAEQQRAKEQKCVYEKVIYDKSVISNR